MKIRIGIRDSRLAAAQGQQLLERLRTLAPEAETELVPCVGGDAQSMDRALLDGQVELTVQALTELPLTQDPRLPLAAFLKRGDAQDALVLRTGLERFPLQGGVIGTGSRRRTLQLASFYPTAEFRPVTGDLETDLDRLDAGAYDALVLAADDLRRQGREDRISRTFHTDQLIPAAGQGILGVQCRADADLPFVPQLGDPETTSCAVAERAFVRALSDGSDGSGTAYAELHNGVLKIVGFCVDDKGEQKRGAIAGRPVRAAEMGTRLAQRLREGND